MELSTATSSSVGLEERALCLHGHIIVPYVNQARNLAASAYFPVAFGARRSFDG